MLPLWKEVFRGLFVQKLCGCTNLKIFVGVCVKRWLLSVFARFCVPSHWNAYSCSLARVQGGARFLARSLGREQSGGNSVKLFSMRCLFFSFHIFLSFRCNPSTIACSGGCSLASGCITLVVLSFYVAM